MLVLLVLSVTAAVAAPGPRPCLREGVQHAGPSVSPPRSAAPLEGRKLGELPDAHLMQALLKRDERGCSILPIVQRNVSRARPAPSRPQGGRERQR